MEDVEAVRRTKAIIPLLFTDILVAIKTMAVFESANDMVPKEMREAVSYYSNTFNITQYSLSLKLALDVARVFDVSDPNRFRIENQEKASLQVLAALIGRDDVKFYFESNSKNWVGGSAPVTLAIAKFLEKIDSLNSLESQPFEALQRVRSFRTTRLAHSLFDTSPDQLPYPYIDDLRILLKLAGEALNEIQLISTGSNFDYLEGMSVTREIADEYHKMLLVGLKSGPR